MANQWFILRDDNRYGPYTLAQMNQFAVTGNLLPIDMVMQEGASQWVPASQVPALFPTDGQLPPPQPGSVPPAIRENKPDTPPGASETAPPPQGLGALASAQEVVKRLWQNLSLWKKIAVVAVGLLALALWAYSKFTGGGSKSALEILLDTGVIGGAVSLVFKILEKKLLGSPEGEVGRADAAPREGAARTIHSPPLFVGLSAIQWIVTLYVVFLAALAGTVLAALLLGRQSIWVTGFAVAVIGGLIAFLSRSYQEIGVSERLTVADYKWSVAVGSSAFFPAVLSLVLGCVVNPAWFYGVYAAIIFLPAIDVVQRFSLVMEPVHSSAGLWIAGSYLGIMFIGCTTMAVVLARPTPSTPSFVPPAEVKESILGTWVETGGEGNAKVEFTKGGQALVSQWGRYYRETEDYKYQFDSDSHLVLLGRHGGNQGEIEMLSKDEIAVKLHSDNKKFVRAGKEKADATPAAVIGKWETLGRDNAGSTLEFTKGGHLTFTSRRSNASFQASYRFRDGGTLDIIPEGEAASRGDSVRYKVEFTSDDELMLVLKENRTRDYNVFSDSVRGKLRRVK